MHNSKNGIPNDVKAIIKKVYPDAIFKNESAKVQTDGYNCGPWIIEYACSFFAVEANAQHRNIADIRQSQLNILQNLQPKQSPAADSLIKNSLFSASQTERTASKLKLSY